MPKKMTPRALAARRANAQKSTGPKTPEGKARVRYNALTHGLFAQAVIPPVLEAYESRQDYDSLLQDLRDEHAPATPTEHMLVESIAASHWRLARLYRTEAAIIARRQDATQDDDALGAPLPHPAIARLRAALDDPAALRDLLAGPGTGRESYTGAQLREFAQGTIATLERRYQEALARWRHVAQTESGLPNPDTIERFGRYEAQLNRHILRALRTLRQLQALRGQLPRPRRPAPGDAPAPPEDPAASHRPRSP